MFMLIRVLPVAIATTLLLPHTLSSAQLSHLSGGDGGLAPPECNAPGTHNPRCGTNPGASEPCPVDMTHVKCRPLSNVPSDNTTLCDTDAGDEACGVVNCSPETNDKARGVAVPNSNEGGCIPPGGNS